MVETLEAPQAMSAIISARSTGARISSMDTLKARPFSSDQRSLIPRISRSSDLDSREKFELVPVTWVMFEGKGDRVAAGQ